MIPRTRSAAKSAGAAATRWMAVFAGAAAGAYAGRVVAAFLYREPVSPLLEADPRALLEQDVAPGFLAAELIGRGLGMGLAGEALVAAVAAGASAIATGPLVKPDEPPPPAPRVIPISGTSR